MKTAAKILCIIALIVGLIWATVGFFGAWVGGAFIASGKEVFYNDSAGADATMESSVNFMLKFIGSFIVIIIGGVLGIVGSKKAPSQMKLIILGILVYTSGWILFPLNNYVAAVIYIVAGLLLVVSGLNTIIQIENQTKEDEKKKKRMLTLISIGIMLLVAVVCSLLYGKSVEKQAKIIAESNIEGNNLGIWEIAYFVDDFGEPTKDKYIRTKIKGTFSNDLTQDSKLGVRFIITSEEIIEIKFYEYDGDSPNVLHSETSYRLLVKDSKEEVHTLQAYHDHDRLLFTPMESKKLYNILLQGGTIKFNIISSNAFSSRDTEYNFIIDNADGFENAIIKLTDGSKMDTKPAIENIVQNNNNQSVSEPFVDLKVDFLSNEYRGPGYLTFSQKEQTLFYFDLSNEIGKVKISGKTYVIDKYAFNKETIAYVLEGNDIRISCPNGEYYVSESGDCAYGNFAKVTITQGTNVLIVNNVEFLYCPFY